MNPHAHKHADPTTVQTDDVFTERGEEVTVASVSAEVKRIEIVRSKESPVSMQL